MRLDSGARLGPYEVLGPLGAGGMGEVYRARDSRLGREVAIKVLPARFAGNPELRQRFEREARAVSSLNHPHICTLHDIGHQDDIDYLVMELIEGETLAVRIERGALPVDLALKIAIEVAEALDKAHRGGIVHRDLKPANIMLTKSGTKLLDFGLAKLTQPEGQGWLAGDGRSLANTVTEGGAILGTVGYLAPEQVRGGKADARSDLFALGAILFEMLTGRRAFKGDSAVATLYAIMNEDPPTISSLAPVSPALERVVRTCLAKDPDERWQSAGDLARELRWIAQDASGSGALVDARSHASARRGRGARIAAAILALIAVLIAGGRILLRGEETASRARVISSITSPENASFSLRNGPMAFSSDGRSLAFVAADSGGRASLWVRKLEEVEPHLLEGTVGASGPFWSPDGRSLAFFADGKLKRLDISGGSPQVLVEVVRGNGGGGGAWMRDGVIIFSSRRAPQIYRVSADGGAVEPAFDGRRRGEPVSQAWPSLLPDGRHFLFTGSSYLGLGSSEQAIYIGSLDRNEAVVPLAMHAVNAVSTGPGRVVFWHDGSLWTQRLDERRLHTTGEPRRIANRVAIDPDLGCGLFAASQTGWLAYHQGGSTQLSELIWVDRAGAPIGSLCPPGLFYGPRLSHDGRRIAVDQSDPIAGVGDIWVFDVARQVGDRITSNPLNETAPIWSPDDRRLYWMSSVGARIGDIHSLPSNGIGREETILASDSLTTPLDITPDGNTLVFISSNPRIGRPADLGVLSLVDHKTSAWRVTPFIERAARLSHDGHWIAYQSDESGQFEVYVQPFPQGGDKWRISTAGGTTPMWRGDDREIFYVTRGREIMSVHFRGKPTVDIGVPLRLFEADIRTSSLVAEYCVSADGQRLLINRMLRPRVADAMTLDQNWHAGH